MFVQIRLDTKRNSFKLQLFHAENALSFENFEKCVLIEPDACYVTRKSRIETFNTIDVKHRNTCSFRATFR